jgi:hypothetical protein
MERPRINFGPPKTFKEAIYRLPDDSHPQIEDDFELGLLSRVRRNIETFLELGLGDAIENRMIMGITKDSLKLMEKWSFKRKKISTRIYWRVDTTIQNQLVGMLPSEKKSRKRVYLYDMEPELDRSHQDGNATYKFICIEAQYKDNNDNITRKHEYLLGFITQEEYDLLSESKPS